jgi:hypothetical protein
LLLFSVFIEPSTPSHHAQPLPRAAWGLCARAGEWTREWSYVLNPSQALSILAASSFPFAMFSLVFLFSI